MADKPWKRRERQVAATFGCRRQVLSGSSGRDDRSQSDSTHDRLFIETKARAHHAARTLYDEVAKKARAEGKIPLVALATNGRPGVLLATHSDHLDAVLAERLRTVLAGAGTDEALVRAVTEALLCLPPIQAG
jgi:hypothetical protein